MKLPFTHTQGVHTCLGGYDLVSGVREGRVDVKAPPVALSFSRDGALLVVATSVREGVWQRGRERKRVGFFLGGGTLGGWVGGVKGAGFSVGALALMYVPTHRPTQQQWQVLGHSWTIAAISSVCSSPVSPTNCPRLCISQPTTTTTGVAHIWHQHLQLAAACVGPHE